MNTRRDNFALERTRFARRSPRRSPHLGAVSSVDSTASVTLTLTASMSEEGSMSGSAKQRVSEVIENLPADATLEDAIERLILLAKTERGLAELDAGRGIDHAEAKRRLLR
jgi:hypothetical protein